MVFEIKNIYFENIELLVCDVTYKFNLLTNEFGDISVIAKYDEAKKIIRELICIGYDIASLEIHKEEFEEYWDEYIISISKENNIPTIWCEKFKRDNGYFIEKSSITYVLDNCNSKCIPMIKSPVQFEVFIGNDECDYNDCESDRTGGGSEYHITIKGDLDLDEVYAKLEEMETRMFRLSKMFTEMNNSSKLFNW